MKRNNLQNVINSLRKLNIKINRINLHNKSSDILKLIAQNLTNQCLYESKLIEFKKLEIVYNGIKAIIITIIIIILQIKSCDVENNHFNFWN